LSLRFHANDSEREDENLTFARDRDWWLPDDYQVIWRAWIDYFTMAVVW